MPNIDLRASRKTVDDRYVGFDINGPKVKPVHVANGVFRTICGKVFNTDGIKRLSYVESKKGVEGYSTQEIRKKMVDDDTLDEEVDLETFDSFRRVLQAMLDADSAVFDKKDDRMISYTMSSKYFLTNYALYEDAGEFMGGVLKAYCPDLVSYIVELLNDARDPLSVLFSPVESEEYSDFDKEFRHSNLPAFVDPNDGVKHFIESLEESSKCLLENLKNQPNRFTALRMFNFYCMYELFKYLASLESFYCGGISKPALFDFSGTGKGSVSGASTMSYAQIHKSLSRFYAWGYGTLLLEAGYTAADLLASDPPIRQSGRQLSAADKLEFTSLWDMAKIEAGEDASEDDIRYSYGMAMYNMLARDSKFHPANYLRALGLLSGFLYPPNSSHNRFVVSQDMLEMIMMCTVEPGTTITKTEVRKRLFDRLGIVIGGSPIEEEYLSKSGMVYQADADSLEANFDKFTSTLEDLGFAEIMADGILQIHIGGVINV